MYITVISDDQELVEEYATFFYDKISRRIVVVPDSMVRNVLGENGHANRKSWVKLSDYPKVWDSSRDNYFDLDDCAGDLVVAFDKEDKYNV